MSNRMTVYGFLGKDAEFKDVNGKRIMELSIASNHKVKGNDISVWRKVTFWDDSHRNIEQYLRKGWIFISLDSRWASDWTARERICPQASSRRWDRSPLASVRY